MTAAILMQRLLRAAFARERWLALAWLLLALWAAGIVVAAWQLGSWRHDLTHTLVQLNADARFRARTPGRDAVDPEWYRRKALALLSATERLRDDGAWTVFMPGSWRGFDNLEEQVQARVAGEFGDIVVETVRRELYARASRLSGVPLVRGTGDLQGGADCQSPVPQTLQRQLTAAAEDLPEFVAVAQYVDGVAQLDAAVQSFLSLQSSGGQPEQLRRLVTYTLGKELPGALEGAVRMFQGEEEVSVQPALMQARLQWATRCALGKGMAALHARLLNTNELLALEQTYVERSAGLFGPAARPAPFERTLERYRAVHALLEDQNTLLAQGRNGWMAQGSLQLGPAYQRVLQRIAHTLLLGPEVLDQLQSASGAAFAEFRRQFEAAFGGEGEPGIVWLDAERRFGLSGERAALRVGLGALLQASFMSPEAARDAKARDTASLGRVIEEAHALAEERARAVDDVVPVFPAGARPVVARVIDARVADLIYQRAFRALKAGLPADARAPLDAAAFRRQREQVLELQGVLKETGGAWFGDRLAAQLDGELLRRLANLRQDWEQLPLQDPGMVPRLGLLVQQARALLALGSPALTDDPAAARWLQLQAELDRYTAHASDSSLLRLERYLAALGPDLRRENCAERLATQAPAALHEDEIAQRHLQLHQALAQRCAELRERPLAPAASLAQ
jgi:type VI secretion system protein ImpL